MADFGLYTAMRGTDNWGQKRQDRMMNLAVQEKREARAQQELNKSMELEEGINKYFDDLANMDVLPEDQERVRQVEKDARQKVIAGITKNNGDLKRYMTSGGISDLHEYKNSVMQSQEVSQAASNKTNLGLYLQDMSKGNKRAKLVDVQVPVMGPNGEPAVDEQGNPMTKMVKMNFDEQMELFRQNKIKSLSYNGAENKVAIGIEDFSKLYKDPKNPYSSNNYVSESDIYKKALGKGASEEYARDLSSRYGGMVKEGGRVWRWNAKDPLDLELKMEQIKKLKLGNQASGRKLTSTRLLNSLMPSLEALEPGEEKVMSGKQNEFWAKTFGMYSDKKTGSMRAPRGTTVYDAHKPSKQYDLGLGTDINFVKYISIDDNESLRHTIGTIRGIGGEEGRELPVKKGRYILANVTYKDPSSGRFNLGGDNPGTPTSDDVGGWTELADEDTRHNWVETGSGDYTGQVLIPIEQYVNDGIFKAETNHFLGLNANADYTPGSVTNEMMMQSAQTDLESIIQQTGMTPEAATQAMIDLGISF